VSPKGCPVGCGGWTMNQILDFDHTAVAELISRRWQEVRPYFTLDRKARGTWLEGSWWRQPGNSAMNLHWSRRSPVLRTQTDFARMALKKPCRGDPG
jgi:hypothetical protein